MSGAEGTAVNPTGEQFKLQLGDQEAYVTEVGAHLRSYTVAGRDVIVPFGADEEPPAGHGAVLAPWPNRLADGRYTFEGQTYQVPINEPERHNALHGLVQAVPFTAVEHTDERVVLALDLVPTEGYPFPVRLQVAYSLDEGGLQVTVTATNTGSTDAPYGIGFHPWLSPGAGTVDESRLSVDAAQWIRPDERLLPLGVEAIPEALDFRAGRTRATTSLYGAYLGAVFRSGRSWVRLRSTDGWASTIWMEAPLGTWQVCTGDFPELGHYERSGVAAEPMSCAADAFNTGRDLTVLAPGQTHEVRWGLVGERPSAES